MANPNIDVKPRPEQERVKAFELFLSTSLEGKPNSLRQIASAVGVSAMTIGRWKEVDEWDLKVSKMLSEAAAGADTTANALKRRVRQGLLDGLAQLQKIALQGDKDSDKIAAVRALADIAMRMDALTAVATAGQSKEQQVEFDDRLPGELDCPATTEPHSRPEGTAVEAELDPTPLPSPQRLNAEASASHLVEEEVEARLAALESEA